MDKIGWLGLFGQEAIMIDQGSPAQVLQSLLEEKWKLENDDKDMVVMQHQIAFKKEGKVRNKSISMVVKGDDYLHTSMAKTVGYPISRAVELLVTGKLGLTGVKVPTIPELYKPILKDIHTIGVDFIVKN